MEKITRAGFIFESFPKVLSLTVDTASMGVVRETCISLMAFLVIAPACAQVLADPSATPTSAPSPTPYIPVFAASYAKTTEDLIGTGPYSSSGDGVADQQVQVSGLTGNIRAIRIQGCKGDTWQWPNSNYYWNIVWRAMSGSGAYSFNFAPSYAQSCYRVTVQYDTNEMVSALAPVDPLKPNCSCVPSAPTIILNVPPATVATPTPTPTPIPPTTSFSATYQVTSEDKIGPGPGAPAPDGKPDYQVLIQNLKANPVGVLIQGRNGDTWITPSNGSFWSILAIQTTDGLKLNLAPSQTQAAYRISVQYLDKSIDSAIAYVDPSKPDASGLPAAPTSTFTTSTTVIFGGTTTTPPTATPTPTSTPIPPTTSFSATYQATSEDKIGPGPGAPTPDGLADRQIVVVNAKAKPVGILIQGRNGDTWMNPSNGSYWSIFTADTTTGIKLNFAPSQTQAAYRVSFQYSDNTIDSAIAYVDPTNPDASGLPSAPTKIVSTSSLAPTVSLASPNSGSTFTAPASITVSANATDSDGSIARVDFYNGSTLIGTDTSAPFSVAVSNLSAGTYAVSAKATDNSNLSATSSAVSFTVAAPNQAPTVVIGAPTSGSTFTAPANITLMADATDPDGSVARVDFYNYTTLIGSDTSAPYSIVWSSVPAGTGSVTARAVDNLGATATSAAATVTVSNGNTAPTISLTSPSNGATSTAPATVTLSATASDVDGSISKVEFYNGATLLGTDTTTPYSFSWSGVGAGSYTLSARAFDNLGAQTNSAAAIISVSSSGTVSNQISVARPSAQSYFLVDPVNASTNVNVVMLFDPTLSIKSASASIGGNSCVLYYTSTFNGNTPAYWGSCKLSTVGVLTVQVSAALSDGSILQASQPIVSSQTSYVGPGASNPYYAFSELKDVVRDWGATTQPSWALADPKLSEVAPVPSSQRWYSTFSTAAVSPEIQSFGGNTTKFTGESAGAYDDYYFSLDNNHSSMSVGEWAAPSYATRFAVQPRVFTGSPSSWLSWVPSLSKYAQSVMALRGVSFSSKSYEMEGHTTLLWPPNQAYMDERDDYFLNYLKFSPALRSYYEDSSYVPEDNGFIPDETIDSYDSLFTHRFHTMAQSASEIPAITKLMAAGSHFSDATKRRLKATGTYALMLQYIYRAALPYSDEKGVALPFENEMRHRPAYLANGFARSAKWHGSNISYHAYSDDLHMREMTKLARGMTTALPPITVASLVDYSVSNGSTTVVPASTWDSTRTYIKSFTATHARIWGRAGDKISVRVDLGGSYDLFDNPLTFSAQPVYPEHAGLVTITKESATRFLITAEYKNTFPRTRIPIILVAKNGTYTGTPVFVNFLFPNDLVTESSATRYFDLLNTSTHINRNKKPTITTSSPSHIFAAVGSTVSIPLACSDDQGFRTRWYRWANEPGAISSNTYTWTVTSEWSGKVVPLHFVCSDGTGAYNSLERYVVVNKAIDQGARVALVDLSSTFYRSSGSVAADGTFQITAGGSGLGVSSSVKGGIAQDQSIDSGAFLYQPVADDFDMAAQVSSFNPSVASRPASFSMMLRSTLDEDSFRYVISAQRSDTAGIREASIAYEGSGSLGVYPYLGSSQLGAGTNSFRVVRRGNGVALFAQDSSQLWEQVFYTESASMFKDGFAGLFLTARSQADANPSQASVQASGKIAIVNPGLRLPVIYRTPYVRVVDPQPLRYAGTQATFAINPDPNSDYTTYSVSGPVTVADTRYQGAFTLSGVGTYEIRATGYKNGAPSGTTVLRVVLAG